MWPAQYAYKILNSQSRIFHQKSIIFLRICYITSLNIKYLLMCLYFIAYNLVSLRVEIVFWNILRFQYCIVPLCIFITSYTQIRKRKIHTGEFLNRSSKWTNPDCSYEKIDTVQSTLLFRGFLFRGLFSSQVMLLRGF